MKFKYLIEIVTGEELESGIDIIEPSMERGMIRADKDGIATWWYGSPNYVMNWTIIKKGISGKRYEN